MNYAELNNKIANIQTLLLDFKKSIDQVTQVENALIDYKKENLKYTEIVKILDDLDARNVFEEFFKIIQNTKKMYANLNSPDLDKQALNFQTQKKEIEQIYKIKDYLDKKESLNYEFKDDTIKFLQNIKISELINDFKDQKKLKIAKKMGWEVEQELTEEQKLKFEIIFDNIDFVFNELIKN